MQEFRKTSDVFLTKYSSISIISDFNAETHKCHLKNFYELYDFRNLAKQRTCFKNPQNPACIDLLSTHKPHSFCNTCLIESLLSDFHKMTFTVFKGKFKPKIVTYRDFKIFLMKPFDRRFYMKNCNNDYNSFTNLVRDYKSLCPSKEMYTRGNQAPFMNFILNKAIMKSSRLRNKFLKTRSGESRKAYNKQRNFCLSLVKKVKRECYSKHNIKNAIDNRTFWTKKIRQNHAS